MAKTKLLQTTRLQTGMVLADDLKLQNTGEVLVTAGTRITEVMVECILHLPVDTECRINAYELLPYESLNEKYIRPFALSVRLFSDKDEVLLAYFKTGSGQIMPLGISALETNGIFRVPPREAVIVLDPLFRQPAVAGTNPSYLYSLDAFPRTECLALIPAPCREVIPLPAPRGVAQREDAPGKRGLPWFITLFLFSVMLLAGALLFTRSPELFFPWQAGPHQSTVSATAWETGSYTGETQNGIPHGRGSINWPDGTVYTGQWHQGKMEGEGEISWPSGARYAGRWQNGLMHGPGTMTRPDGEVIRGTWEYGRLQQ